MPWWLKMASKLSLSFVVPGHYERIRRFVTGRYGDMDDPSYAIEIFRKYYSAYKKYCDNQNGMEALLEMGPEGSLATGILAHTVGFKKSILVDVGDFAQKDIRYYNNLLDILRREDFPHRQSQKEVDSFDSLIRTFSISYMTKGLYDLKLIDSKSVDFVFSNSVFEHIRFPSFIDTCRELYRIQKPGSIGCHHVDLKDHLGGGLNNLRFSSTLWEKEWMALAGFYTNRIRLSTMVNILSSVGFDVTVLEKSTWDKLPIAREKLAFEFQNIPSEILLVKGAMLILEKRRI